MAPENRAMAPMRTAAATTIAAARTAPLQGPNVSSLRRCMWFLLQVAETEAFALDHRAAFERQGAGKHRAGVHEAVKLTVFAAGIDLRGQLAEELLVELPAGELRGKLAGIHAHGHGAESLPAELPRQRAGVPFPQRKYRLHPGPGQV